MRSITIAADRSNSGKTTISLGLMWLLRKYGKVRGFKIGPDFIDPKFHEVATGLPSVNLDYYLMGEKIRDYFLEYSNGIDYGIVEGVMGLYDGMGGKYSTFDTSSHLGIPIIAVIDCSYNSTTSSAILHGLRNFKNADIRGVIFNNVASPSHYYDCSIGLPQGVKNLGYVKHKEDISIKSRHLGLILPDEDTREKIRIASEAIEENVDIESVISIMEEFEGVSDYTAAYKVEEKPLAAVAYDDAFSFYYKLGLDSIARKYNIKYFSPLRDETVENAEFIYVGGGYPELFAETLERNSKTKEWLKKSSDNGEFILGECGGLMYLSSSLEVGEKDYDMTGIFDARITMNSSLTIGYTELNVLKENPYFETGINVRGHEFHKSKVIEYHENTSMNNVRGKGLGDGKDGIVYNNTMASYSHFMLNGSEKFLKNVNI